MFARRIAADIAARPARSSPSRRRSPARPWAVDPAVRPALQRAMTRGAGVLRSAGRSPRPPARSPARRDPRPPPAPRAGRRPTWSRSPRRWSPPPRAARRPAAATGARTSRGPRRVARPPARRPRTGAGTLDQTWEPLRVNAVDRRATLRAAGLDPAAVRADRRRRARRGPRPGRGVDVTSVATIPAEQVDIGRPGGPGRRRRRRAAGRRGGLRRSPAPRTVEFERKAPRRRRVARGDVLATVTGPTRALLDRRADRAQPALPACPGWPPTRGPGPTRWPAPRRRVLDTRKTTPGLRIAGEVRGAGRRRHEQADGPVRRRDDQGQPQAGGGRARARRTGGSAAAFPDVPVQVEVTTVGGGGRGGRGRRRRSCCATTCRPTLLREVVAAVGDRAELEATGGLTLDGRGRVRRDRRRLPFGGGADPFVAYPGHRTRPAPAAELELTPHAAVHRHR